MGTNVKLGNKYYRYIDNNILEVIRIVKFKNEDTFSAINLTTNERYTITEKELSKYYILLRPDGYITFAVVGLEQNCRDVLISLHRRKDIEDANQVPYAVCRQNILDLFANQIIRDQNVYIGASISKDTCPEDVDFNITLACNEVLTMEMVSIYIDDKLDTILNMIKLKLYDSALQHMYKSITNENLKGYCLTLKQLLEDNYFMYDFYRAFDIYPVKFTIDISNITKEYAMYFENLLKCKIDTLYILPYNKDIDLADIKRDYILASDNTETLYIVLFDKGDYINREYESLQDKSEYLYLSKYTNNKLL